MNTFMTSLHILADTKIVRTRECDNFALPQLVSQKMGIIPPAESFRPYEYASSCSFIELAFQAELSANPQRQGFGQWVGRLQFTLVRRGALAIVNHSPTDKISIAYITPNFCDSGLGRKRHLQQHQRRWCYPNRRQRAITPSQTQRLLFDLIKESIFLNL